MTLGMNQRALKECSSAPSGNSTKKAITAQRNCRRMERSYDALRVDVGVDGAEGIANRARRQTKLQAKFQPLDPQDVDARHPRDQALRRAILAMRMAQAIVSAFAPIAMPKNSATTQIGKMHPAPQPRRDAPKRVATDAPKDAIAMKARPRVAVDAVAVAPAQKKALNRGTRVRLLRVDARQKDARQKDARQKDARQKDARQAAPRTVKGPLQTISMIFRSAQLSTAKRTTPTAEMARTAAFRLGPIPFSR